MKPKLLIAIGSSAGGLKEVEIFFKNMPKTDGIAFVLVQHLSPHHKSFLGEIVGKYTGMDVMQISKDQTIESGNVYVIPPDKVMKVSNSKLVLSPVKEKEQRYSPIDIFFHSLAEVKNTRIMGIILSGSGKDGSAGIKSIKKSGGLTIVQEPSTADFDSMPASAIKSGYVDYVIPVEEMPAMVIDYLQHDLDDLKIITREDVNTEWFIQEVFKIMKQKTGNDFSRYKRNTLYRRIERRLNQKEIKNLEQYISILSKDDNEVEHLFSEMIISVTSFFRDTEVFVKLNKEIIPNMLKDFKGKTFRVWVPACATGEEAYTLSILIHDYISAHQLDLDYQIFASDIDKNAIQKARNGYFKHNIVGDIDEKLLQKYFKKDEMGYQVKGVIRDSVVFAEQNLTQDPPYSKVDLISCRNLLIYFSKELQQKAISVFHYALKKNGILILGNSESLGKLENLFSVLDGKLKIYTKISDTQKNDHIWRINYDSKTYKRTKKEKPIQPYSVLADELIKEYFTPPSVLIDQNGEMLYISGKTGKYLENPEGNISNNIAKHARQGLKIPLSNAIRKAKSENKEIKLKNIKVKTNGDFEYIDLIVKPYNKNNNKNKDRNIYLVVFQPSDQVRETTEKNMKESVGQSYHDKVVELEKELAEKEQYLQNTIEELETTNEELKSSNEEVQSSNEELQSTIEELETSKEELQSVNEELTTSNNELSQKLEEINNLASTLKNLMAATEIATIFLDTNLKIFNFTPAVKDIVDLLPADIGRRIHQFNNKLENIDLVKESRMVLKNLKTRGQEVRNTTGDIFWMRINPYYTTQDVVEGVVITFTNITEKKKQEEELNAYWEKLEEMVEEKSGQLIKSEERFKKISANASDYAYSHYIDKEGNLTLDWSFGAFKRITGYEPEEMTDKETIRKLIHPADHEALEERFKKVLEGESVTSEFRIITKNGIIKWIRDKITVEKVTEEGNFILKTIGVANDITNQKIYEEQIVASERKFRNIAENVPGLVLKYKLNPDGTDQLLYLSKGVEKLLGLDYEKALNNINLIWDLIHPDDIEEYKKSLHESFENMYVWEIEHRIITPQGEEKWISAHGEPVKMHDGSVVWDTIAIDITEKRRIFEMEQNLKIANNTAQIKHQLLSNMSHEMRTPMNGIIGMSQMLAETNLNTTQKDYLNTIMESSETLLSLINDVLDLSKFESGKILIREKSVNLSDIRSRVINQFAIQAKTKNLELTFHLSDQLPGYILTDETRLLQVLMNLVSNAIKFTYTGKVSIEASLLHEKNEELIIEFKIKDTGIGIRENFLPRIFDEFSQQDGSSTREHDGSGLGLTISKKIARSLKGDINVVSREGEGSIFSFTFKTKKSDPLQKEDEKDNNKPAPLNMKVLLVEDKIINQKVAGLILENMGCSVKKAENGKKGLEMIRMENFDVVLMDIQMPVMNGVTAVKEMKKLNKKDLPPVIGLSAEAMEGDAEKYINLGMDDYITKPIVPKILYNKLKQFSKDQK